MPNEKAPSKAEFLVALSKKGINSLEDLIEAIMPESDETGGYFFMDMGAGSDAAGDFADIAQAAKGHGPDGWKLPMGAAFRIINDDIN